MKIKAKVFVAVGAVFLVSMSVFFAWSKLSLEKDFDHLEKLELDQNIERLRQTYNGEIDNLHGNIVDYAKWDASEIFIEDNNSSYISDNYNPETPMGLGLNLIAIIKNGELIFSQESDTLGPVVHKIMPLTEQALKNVGAFEKNHANVHETKLIGVNGKLMVVTWMTIQKGDESGSKQGTMVFGRYLDKEILQVINDKTQNKTQMLLAANLEKLLQTNPEITALNDTSSISQATSDSTYEFKQLYRDFKGQPAVLFDVSFKRQTMQTGKQTIFNMLLGIAILGLLLLIATLIAVNGAVLAKLKQLSSSVGKISKKSGPGARVPQDQARDEISDLQRSINVMLESIDEKNIVIEEKSRSMENMLCHMEQGLLLINTNGKIHPEYSAFTESIFYRQELANLAWDELLFKDCLLDADRRSQMEASMLSVLGEDLFNWELNSDSILKELQYERDGHKQYLEFSYTPLVELDDQVGGVLVSVRDVTLLRRLTQEAEFRQQELSLLEKLLELSPLDMSRFVQESLKRLEIAENLVANSNLEIGQIHALFRELHTLKGNSRTCGFRELSAMVHEAEEPVQKMRNIGYQSDLKHECAEQLQVVRRGIVGIQDLYNERFKKFLGSSIATTMLLLPKDEIHRLLEGCQGLNLHDPEVAEKFLGDIQKTLDEHSIDTQHGWASVHANPQEITADSVARFMHQMAESCFSPVNDKISKIHLGLESVAVNLGIVHPHLEISNEEFLVRNEYISSIEAVVGHILRNSYDHGIEKPDLRLALGKPSQGRIQIDFGMNCVDGGEFERPCIWFGDDGGGLDLDLVRKKALEKGLIEHNATEHEIAMAIFKPGFSSRDEITEISGRGVGLDVVMQEMKSIGGNVDLDLQPKNEFGKVPFRICLTLPRLSSLIFME